MITCFYTHTPLQRLIIYQNNSGRTKDEHYGSKWVVVLSQ